MSGDGDDDDDRLTREEIRERYGWRDDAEREAAHAEAERLRQQIEGERILREAWAAKEAREAREAAVVTKSAPVTQPRVAAAAPVDWDAWRAFILATVRKEFVTDKMLNKVVEQVGKTVSDWDVEVCRLTKEKREEALAPLRAEITQLRVEVAELRGAALQRAQPTMSVAEERRRAGALTRARQEIERLRAAGLKCDGDARDLDLSRVRGAFDEWRH